MGIKTSSSERAQKRFERLGLHRKQNDSLNIWTCEVTGPRKGR
ncbi:conjugal transfer nickase/helicase domain-containing protein [Burkholderia pseudomallei]|nr:DNA-binding domain-containing protein [Burkholderia pseudomallei]